MRPEFQALQFTADRCGTQEPMERTQKVMERQPQVAALRNTSMSWGAYSDPKTLSISEACSSELTETRGCLVASGAGCLEAAGALKGSRQEGPVPKSPALEATSL